MPPQILIEVVCGPVEILRIFLLTRVSDVVFQFAEARSDRLKEVLGRSSMFKAIEAGHQWCWERRQEVESPLTSEMRTNSIVAMISNDDTQDISFVLRVGYQAGYQIVKFLDFRSSEEFNK